MRGAVVAVLVVLVGLVAGCASLPSQPETVIKVLPQLLDREGRHAVSPSLFDRDAYQAWLRQHPDQVSGIRYQVQWRVQNQEPHRLRLELRGAFGEREPRRKAIEVAVQGKPQIARWTSIPLTGEEYRDFGEIIAWRVSLWRDGEMMAEQTSFLWAESRLQAPAAAGEASPSPR